MVRRHLLVPAALLAVLGLAGACSGGPISISELPVSGDSLAAATVLTCLDAPGRIRVVVDSTTTGNPSYVKVEINHAAGTERFDIWPDVPSGAHFDDTSTMVHGPGCVYVSIEALCISMDNVCSGGWWHTSRSFHYEVSRVA